MDPLKPQKLDLLSQNSGNSGAGSSGLSNSIVGSQNPPRRKEKEDDQVMTMLKEIYARMERSEKSPKACLHGITSRLPLFESQPLQSTLNDNPNRGLTDDNPSPERRPPQVPDNSEADVLRTSNGSIFESSNSARSSLKTNDFPTFDGNREKSASLLLKYEFCAAANNWQGADLVKAVGKCLKDYAERWYIHVYLANVRADEHTWIKFKEMLRETYVRTTDSVDALTKILQRKQRENERCTTYFHSMLALFHAYDEHFPESAIVTHVLRGMHPITNSLLSGNPSLSLLAQHIRNINDNVINSSKKNEPSNKGEFKSESKRKFVNEDSRRRDPTNLICYNCLCKGHYLSNCKKVMDQQRIEKNKKDLLERSRSPVVNNLVVGNSDSESEKEERQETKNVDAVDTDEWTLTSNVSSVIFDLKVKLPTLKVSIKDKEKAALVDTGAKVSLMSDKFRKICQLKLKNYDFGVLTMANGNKDYPFGYVTCKMKVDHFVIPMKFIVMLRMNQDLILGADFCNDHGVQIQFTTKEIKLLKPAKDVFILDQTNSVQIGNVNETIDPEKGERSWDVYQSLIVPCYFAPNCGYVTNVSHYPRHVKTCKYNPDFCLLCYQLTTDPNHKRINCLQKLAVQVELKKAKKDNELSSLKAQIVELTEKISKLENKNSICCSSNPIKTTTDHNDPKTKFSVRYGTREINIIGISLNAPGSILRKEIERKVGTKVGPIVRFDHTIIKDSKLLKQHQLAYKPTRLVVFPLNRDLEDGRILNIEVTGRGDVI